MASKKLFCLGKKQTVPSEIKIRRVKNSGINDHYLSQV